MTSAGEVPSMATTRVARETGLYTLLVVASGMALVAQSVRETRYK